MRANYLGDWASDYQEGAMDAFTAPAPAETQPYWADCECCDGERGHHYYDRDAYEPCECCDGTGGRWLDANDNEMPAPAEPL